MTVPTNNGAAPSPFAPIANYGFLSNCHTGALVAPDGTVDWLCVPRFDSPSVFGALLDRGAGGFRFAPFGINVPSDRIYEPGTNTLVTSWKTPTGWVVVRDALTIGPRRGEDTVTPNTRPPFDQDADHALVRTATCINGTVEIDLVCEPAFDYGRVPGRWEHVGGLIRLLDHSKFQVGLVEAEAASELEISLKTTEKVMLRSADHRELWEVNPQWGPRLLACGDLCSCSRRSRSVW